MDATNIGGAVTSYLVAAAAIITDAGPTLVLGFLLLVVRLIYEALRLAKYIKNWSKKDVTEGS